MSKLVESLMLHEGFEAKPYRDSEGHLTIGYGRNLEVDGISTAEAEVMLRNDITEALLLCNKELHWFGILDEVRRDVVTEMVFNLGITKFQKFTLLIEAIKRGDWREASQEMLKSLWARQVKDRAFVLSKIMFTGNYPDFTGR